ADPGGGCVGLDPGAPCGHGELTAWRSGPAFTTVRERHSSALDPPYLYVIGGCSQSSSMSNSCDTGAAIADVQVSTLGPDGLPGAGGGTPPVPAPRRRHTSPA